MNNTVMDMNWVFSLEKRVSDTKYRDKEREPTIYKVPDILKKVDPQAYEPLLFSLGPYHHDKSHLQSMNQLKWKYLKFAREQNPSATLMDYVDRIKTLEMRARETYSQEVNMSSDSFVEMMLLDGCVVMLIIMQCNEPMMKISEEITSWTLGVAIRDIFMLENQLPFGILETLYECAYPSGNPFRSLTVKFINNYMSSQFQPPSPNETFHHIIHLCLSCIDPTTNLENGNGNGNGDGDGDDNQSAAAFGSLRLSELGKTVLSKPFSSLLSLLNKIRTLRDDKPQEDFHVSALAWIPNATLFHEAGVQFKRKKRAKSFVDITFHNGKLEIPQLQIDDHTNSLLRNLIAYEQCSMDSNFLVTSYAILMDRLIDTAADVELLQQDEIIISGLGDSQVVATLLNKLAILVCYDDYYFVDVLKDMKKYRNTRCNKWRARLNRDYFGNPWAIISLFGVLALFFLAVTQTIFAILSYCRSSN